MSAATSAKGFKQEKLYCSSQSIKTRFYGSKVAIGDQIGIIPLGQKIVQDCLLVRPAVEDEDVVFPSYCLPQSKTDFYQFIYIKKDGTIMARSLPFIIQIPLDELNSFEEDFLENGADLKDESISVEACNQLKNFIKNLKKENRNLYIDMQRKKRNHLEENLTPQKDENLGGYADDSDYYAKVLEIKDEIEITGKEIEKATRSRKYMEDKISSLHQLMLSLKEEINVLDKRNDVIRSLRDKKMTSKTCQKEIEEMETKLTSHEEGKKNALAQVEVLKKENAQLNKQMEALKINVAYLYRKIYEPKQNSVRAQYYTL